MTSALEELALETKAIEIESYGAARIHYSQAISLKRIADAVEELTVIASAPKPEVTVHRLEKNEGVFLPPWPKLIAIDDGLKWFTEEEARERWPHFLFPPKSYMDSSKGEGTVERVYQTGEPISTKTTSPEMASLAAKYMGFSGGEMWKSNPAEIIESDIRRLAACVLSQKE